MSLISTQPSLSFQPQQMETGQVDIALMTPETTPSDLHARRLFDERYVCTFRKDHPVLQLPLTQDQFCAADVAVVPEKLVRHQPTLCETEPPLA